MIPDTAGAQCDGRISDREVEDFVARLDLTPDGRSERVDYGRQIVLSAVWGELAGWRS